MKVAILSPVHGNDASWVVAQNLNYSHFLGCTAEIRFFYHISTQSSQEFRKQLTGFCVDSPFPTHVSEISRMTSLKSVLNALIQLGIDLRASSWRPDYVYWHSESDLLIKKGADDEMARYTFGTGSWPIDVHNSTWTHIKGLQADPRINLLTEQILGRDVGSLRYGRVEGSFMNISLWEQVLGCILDFFDNDYFDCEANHWCVEEVLLPTLADRFAGKNCLSRQQLCYTKPVVPAGPNRDPGDQKIQISDIRIIREEGDFFAAKWFSPSLDDDARLFLLKMDA